MIPMFSDLQEFYRWVGVQEGAQHFKARINTTCRLQWASSAFIDKLYTTYFELNCKLPFEDLVFLVFQRPKFCNILSPLLKYLIIYLNSGLNKTSTRHKKLSFTVNILILLCLFLLSDALSWVLHNLPDGFLHFFGVFCPAFQLFLRKSLDIDAIPTESIPLQQIARVCVHLEFVGQVWIKDDFIKVHLLNFWMVLLPQCNCQCLSSTP